MAATAGYRSSAGAKRDDDSLHHDSAHAAGQGVIYGYIRDTRLDGGTSCRLGVTAHISH
jgi:hypothetical protein